MFCNVGTYCSFSVDESDDGPHIETTYEEENEPEYLGEVSGKEFGRGSQFLF